ncbi:hypothetical protein [Methylovulum psychrotolerans]|uniref:Uncharacterized protein n=1 Tax=Methylovulum psychrotolerans TaxID=1704499 RepID=A0A2S5CGF1_9GAMM|nr:hypothetical protein [Methylovulum psychrotolerans]POZ49822.1 hypothetical protein AADEFJLK_04437 [Methylovulum psychrotolerans]
MNETLEKAFKSLSVTCNKTALHPSDEDRIKVTLRVLHQNNIAIDVESLESFLLENGWQKMPIKNIVSWATAVCNGGRVQVGVN